MKKRYSKILKQDISIDEKKGMVITEDGIAYTRDELALLKNVNDDMKYICHRVKNIFDGKIVKYKKISGGKMASVHETIVTQVMQQCSKENRGRLFKNHNGNAWLGAVLYEEFQNNKRIIGLSGASRIKYGLGVGTGDLIGWEYVKIASGKRIPIFCTVEVKTKKYPKFSMEQIDWLNYVDEIGGHAYVAYETGNGYKIERWVKV